MTAKEPAASEQEAAPARPEPIRGAGAPVLLRERYNIYPATPLGDMNMPTVQAFVAEDRRDPSRLLFAYICKSDMPVRAMALRNLRSAQSMSLMHPVEWGVVDWPPVARRCLAVVYDRQLGGRVMASLAAETAPLDEHTVFKRFVEPLVHSLRELSTHNITHRAIRPTNLFYADYEREHVLFGDCACTPPALDQPVLFETIESALCQPAGRGAGNTSDDLYALGVTLLFLLNGRNPVGHLDDEAIINGKIVHGSYAFLVGDTRLPLSMIELLRGLLCDDPSQRWTLEEIGLWMGGRRLTPLQTKPEKRAPRGFAFGDIEYGSCRELAHAMAQNWDQAAAPILDGRLEIWLRRAIDDKDRAELIASAVHVATIGGSDRRVAEDILIAKAITILDPASPIRYRGFSAMSDGFGGSLAVTLARGQEPRALADCLLREIPKYWQEARGVRGAEAAAIENHFREMKTYLTQTGLGYGIERVLYELNEEMPCQSPLVAEDYVLEVKDLLPALNNAAKRIDPKTSPIDRHIAAFIASHFGHDISVQIGAINDSNEARQTLGMLSLLAVLQWRAGPDAVFGLASWVGGLAGAVINSYHSRAERRVIEKEIPRLVRKGSLPELYNLLDNVDARKRDTDGFSAARAEYLAGDAEIRELQGGGEALQDRAERVGKQTAALVSILIGLCTISVMLVAKIF